MTVVSEAAVLAAEAVAATMADFVVQAVVVPSAAGDGSLVLATMTVAAAVVAAVAAAAAVVVAVAAAAAVVVAATVAAEAMTLGTVATG